MARIAVSLPPFCYAVGGLNVRGTVHTLRYSLLAVSPAAYQGVGGLNPMMRTLKAAGYDVEWFIIVLVR